MNVRFSAGQVRVRLDRSEGEALARGEPVVEEVAIPGGKLGWRVEPGVASEPTVELRGTTLVVTVSGAAVGELLGHTRLKELGIVALVPVAGSPPLKVEVEVDALSGKKR